MHSVALLPTEAVKKYRIFRMLKTPSQMLEEQDWLGQVQMEGVFVGWIIKTTLDK